MTIKIIYRVKDDSNDYDSEQEAQIAEVCKNYKGMFLTQSELKCIAEAISEKYFLTPIIKTETVVVTQAELDQRDLDSYGPSA